MRTGTEVARDVAGILRVGRRGERRGLVTAQGVSRCLSILAADVGRENLLRAWAAASVLAAKSARTAPFWRRRVRRAIDAMLGNRPSLDVDLTFRLFATKRTPGRERALALESLFTAAACRVEAVRESKLYGADGMSAGYRDAVRLNVGNARLIRLLLVREGAAPRVGF